MHHFMQVSFGEKKYFTEAVGSVQTNGVRMHILSLLEILYFEHISKFELNPSNILTKVHIVI